jgi:hypothetical protein
MAQFWETIQFWKRPKMLEEGKDFVFIPFKDSDITGIQIIDGEYKGVLYHYHKVRVAEEGEVARLQFGYTIVSPGEHDIDVLNSDEGFVTIMGDILTQIIMGEAKDAQTRTDDTEEFDSQ